MGFIRRLLGGHGGSSQDGPSQDDRSEGGPSAAVGAGEAGTGDPTTPIHETTADEDERAHELEMARFEQDRVDELVRRQQRYADRSWTPPAQGGTRRSGDDSDAGA